MRPLVAAALIAVLAPAAAGASSDTSLRCQGGIVSLGDATIDLLGKCGVPTLREVQSSSAYVAVDTVGARFGRSAVLTSERWTYDFGPQQFVMLVRIEGGKVLGFHRGSYGYARGGEPVQIPRATCDSSAIKVGDTKLDLLARCGEPVLVELRKEHLARGVPAVLRDSAFVPGALRDVEVWTYDFGPQAFVRFVVLDEGIVVRVETGNPGYAR